MRADACRMRWIARTAAGWRTMVAAWQPGPLAVLPVLMAATGPADGALARPSKRRTCHRPAREHARSTTASMPWQAIRARAPDAAD